MVNARGYLFLFLNTVRVLSIISLLLLFSSSILSMVQDVKAVNAFLAAGKIDSDPTPAGNSTSEPALMDDDYIDHSTVPNQAAGAFWAVLNWLLIIFQCLVLALSELSLNFSDKFFAAYFPILGPEFGLGALGVIQCLLGAAVLSHHVNEFALVSAFLLFSVGCLNVLLGLLFREKAKWKRSIREWRESEEDVLPPVNPSRSASRASGPPPFAMGKGYGYGYGDEKGGMDPFRSGSLSGEKSGMGFGRQGQKFAAAQGFIVRSPEEAVPPYAPKPVGNGKHAHFAHVSVSSRSSSSYTDSRRNSRHGSDGGDDESGHHASDRDRDHDHEHEGAHPMSRTNSSATAVDD